MNGGVHLHNVGITESAVKLSKPTYIFADIDLQQVSGEAYLFA